jgi:hypothetical protein
MRRTYLRRRRVIGPSFPYVMPTHQVGPAGYQGLADIAGIASWYGIWSTRAAGNAFIGGNAFRLRNPADWQASPYDAPTVAGGGVLEGSFPSTHTKFSRLWMQTGSLTNPPAYDAFDNANNNDTIPNLALDHIKSGCPTIHFASASAQRLYGVNYIGTSLSIPWTIIAIARHESVAGNQVLFGTWDGSSKSLCIWYEGATNTLVVSGSSGPGFRIACSDGHYHVIIVTVAGLSSRVSIDGGAPLVCGSDFVGESFIPSPWAIGAQYNVTYPMDGYIAEFAFAYGDQSSNVGAIYSNIAAYFGNFPI